MTYLSLLALRLARQRLQKRELERWLLFLRHARRPVVQAGFTLN